MQQTDANRLGAYQSFSLPSSAFPVPTPQIGAHYVGAQQLGAQFNATQNLPLMLPTTTQSNPQQLAISQQSSLQPHSEEVEEEY